MQAEWRPAQLVVHLGDRQRVGSVGGSLTVLAETHLVPGKAAFRTKGKVASERYWQRIRRVILEDNTAVVERSNHRAKPLLARSRVAVRNDRKNLSTVDRSQRL